MSQIPILVAGIVIMFIIIFFVFSDNEDTPEQTYSGRNPAVY